ncbi:MAG: protein kinase [Polyangiales bacterium]
MIDASEMATDGQTGVLSRLRALAIAVQREHDAVSSEFALLNLRRIRTAAVLVVVVNAVHVLLFALAPSALAARQPQWRTGVIAMHVAMALATTALGLASHWMLSRRASTRAGEAASTLMAAAVLGFGGGLAVIDQWVTPSITPAVLSAIAGATVLLLRPRVAAALYATVAVVVIVTLPLTQRDPAQLLSNRVNVFALECVAAFLSAVLWRKNASTLLLQRALSESNAALERKQSELAALNHELEARIDQKASELIERAAQVQSLAAQLQQRIEDRSRDLANLLALARSEQRPTVTVGAVMGHRVKLVSAIAVGGMATVFEGLDLATGEAVAVKVLQGAGLVNSAMLQRFLRESRAAAKVEHPAVARMLHVDVSEGGVPFQVQELVRGVPLSAALSAEAGVARPALEVARFGAVLAEALSAAHAAGVVHRDIKPSNLMLTASAPGVKLLDFGIAKIENALDVSVTGTHEIVGTPEYMAPEQVLTPSLVDDRSDVYLIGLVLYRLVAGRNPFEGNSPIALMTAHSVKPPPALDAEVPSALREIIARCLAKEARLRPSAFEVAVVLRSLADSLGAPPLEVISTQWIARVQPHVQARAAASPVRRESRPTVAQRG